MILHHYDISPYSEKIRRALAYSGAEWYSYAVEAYPPRATTDNLTGGYRRIPVAQSGGDIFCDSQLILNELAVSASCPSLSLKNCSDADKDWFTHIDTDVLFASMTAIPAAATLMTMLRALGILGMYRLIKDRRPISSEVNAVAPTGAAAKEIVLQFIATLSRRLENADFINGDEPGALDFAACMPFWFVEDLSRQSFSASDQRVIAWKRRLADFNGDKRVAVDAAFVCDQACADPRPLPASQAHQLLGRRVAIAPTDYAKRASSGELVAVTDERYVIAREAKGSGTVHVHFPVRGYELEAV